MAKYIVKGGEWSEGHQVGDEIELDENAAEARVELGELEPVKAKKAVKKKTTKKKKK